MIDRDEVLGKEASHGYACLNPVEREVYFLYRSICELDLGGLSGLLYNISPDWNYLRELSAILTKLGKEKLAALFTEVEFICRSGPSDHHGTWGDWLTLADPGGRLKRIDDALQREQAVIWDVLDELAR